MDSNLYETQLEPEIKKGETERHIRVFQLCLYRKSRVPALLSFLLIPVGLPTSVPFRNVIVKQIDLQTKCSKDYYY